MSVSFLEANPFPSLFYNSVRTEHNTLDSSAFKVVVCVPHELFESVCAAAGAQDKEHVLQYLNTHVVQQGECLYFDGTFPTVYTEDFPHRKAVPQVGVRVSAIQNYNMISSHGRGRTRAFSNDNAVSSDSSAPNSTMTTTNSNNVELVLQIDRVFPLSSAHTGSSFRCALFFRFPRDNDQILISNPFKVLAKQGKLGCTTKQVYLPMFDAVPKERVHRQDIIRAEALKLQDALIQSSTIVDPSHMGVPILVNEDGVPLSLSGSEFHTKSTPSTFHISRSSPRHEGGIMDRRHSESSTGSTKSTHNDLDHSVLKNPNPSHDPSFPTRRVSPNRNDTMSTSLHHSTTNDHHTRSKRANSSSASYSPSSRAERKRHQSSSILERGDVLTSSVSELPPANHMITSPTPRFPSPSSDEKTPDAKFVEQDGESTSDFITKVENDVSKDTISDTFPALSAPQLKTSFPPIYGREKSTSSGLSISQANNSSPFDSQLDLQAVPSPYSGIDKIPSLPLSHSFSKSDRVDSPSLLYIDDGSSTPLKGLPFPKAEKMDSTTSDQPFLPDPHDSAFNDTFDFPPTGTPLCSEDLLNEEIDFS